MMQAWQDCPVCERKGWVTSPKEQCPNCKGSGIVPASIAEVAASDEYRAEMAKPLPSSWVTCPTCLGVPSTEEEVCPICEGSGRITARLAQALSRRSELTATLHRMFGAPSDGPDEVQMECRDCKAQFTVPVLALAIQKRFPLFFARCDSCQEVVSADAFVAETERRRMEWEERIAGWWERWTPEHFRGESFATFRAGGNGPVVLEAFDAAQEWADAWDWRKPAAQPGLVLHSKVRGTGKSHLMFAAVRRVMERCAPDPEALIQLVRNGDSSPGGPLFCPVQVWKADQLLLLIAQSRRPVQFGEDAPRHATEESIYEGLARTRLLCIDDLGQAPSELDEKRQRAIWEKVIGDRYDANLPILATTNLAILDDQGRVADELRAVVGDRGVSRLQSMVDFVSMAGKDYRPLERQRKRA